jgi:hypothetical protein
MAGTLNKLKYGWSKYGGGWRGLEQEPLSDKWCCQACGEIHPKVISPYMFEWLPREFVRICASCHYKTKKKKIKTFKQLKITVKKRSYWDSLQT